VAVWGHVHDHLRSCRGDDRFRCFFLHDGRFVPLTSESDVFGLTNPTVILAVVDRDVPEDGPLLHELHPVEDARGVDVAVDRDFLVVLVGDHAFHAFQGEEALFHLSGAFLAAQGTLSSIG